jgi:16S rRNA (cytosine967-C5)-methyltransferase
VGTGRSRARSSRRAPRDTSRRVALRVIRRVTERGAYSTLALAAELGRSRLSARDRAFAADLAYGTLRKLISIDRAVSSAATRPLEGIDPEALALLRLGAYQLLFTRVPDHAAVSETVALAGPAHRGFVNAVLRTAASTPPVHPRMDEDEAVSLRTGLATWAVAELRRLLPQEEVEEAAAALASPAALSLRVNRCRTKPEEVVGRLTAAGLQVHRGRHHPDVLVVPSATPAKLPGFADGSFAVQDEASVLVAAALQVRAGERVLDVAAAPGGKAAHLACVGGRDGSLVAGDVRLARARLVRRTADRLGVRVTVLVQDARQPAVRGPFDAVLVDAPCSGLGAARRRPELLWRPSKQAQAGLARLQVAMLVGAADLVSPGGRLVYSVCTFPRAETDAAVRAFMGKRSDFEPMPVPGPDGPAPSHRLWPHRHGTDGMFYAGFRRISERSGRARPPR